LPTTGNQLHLRRFSVARATTRPGIDAHPSGPASPTDAGGTGPNRGAARRRDKERAAAPAPEPVHRHNPDVASDCLRIAMIISHPSSDYRTRRRDEHGAYSHMVTAA
jgi:hypothetical protein